MVVEEVDRPQGRKGPGEAAGGDGRVSLAEEAYALLREKILRVELWPGATFSESQLVGQLELGKTPIREALLRLRLEGLVLVQPRAGYQVAPATLKGTRDALGLRAVLDAEAAARASEQQAAGPALRELDEEIAGSARSSVAECVDSDHRFHVAVARASGNDSLAEAVDRSFVEYVRLAHLAAAIEAAWAPRPHAHGELVEAIDRGDAGAARELARAEARDAELRIVEALISSDSITTANVLPASSNTFYLDIPRKHSD
jgi:GntR family transcriptional regulator, rspAB operon transcriptional repressor